MLKKKICVFTGTRAEYGLLKPLMDEINNDSKLDLKILVSGTHLSTEFGDTYKEIKKDGFRIDQKVDIKLKSDTTVGVAKSMGLGVEGFAKAYKKIQPGLVVILGDRFEAFSAASAAMISRIPVAHLNGGELTFGLIDEAIRHSITKMSHLHFVATEEYKRRVIQLGENPRNVFNVGSIGLDNIKKIKLLSKNALERELKFKFNKRNLLVTFHPVTLESDTSEEYFKNLLDALDELKDTHIIFTKANADMGGRIINKMIDKYVHEKGQKAICFISMGQLKYLSSMRYVDAVVGNSSSGIIEAPSFGIGTINIGDRQKGRIRAKSVIDCAANTMAIKKAFKKLFSDSFKKKIKKIDNPYGDGKTARRIKKILKRDNLKDIIKKDFYDIEF